MIILYLFAIAPLAGVWIEILKSNVKRYKTPVAPFAGVWIKISSQLAVMLGMSSRKIYLPALKLLTKKE